MGTAIETQTPLARLYHWEKTAGDKVHFTQPIDNGQVETYTWKQIMLQVRSMAAHLQSLDIPANSQIALIGKNSAHWMMADWAIWMAGHCTVPIYPTLNAETVKYILAHSESKLLIVGKLDDWDEMKPGVPADMPMIDLPMAPANSGEKWDDIIAKTAPLEGEPDRGMEEMATIVYTSGSTGQPKGVMHNFNAFRVCGTSMIDMMKIDGKTVDENDRLLSYLPLAHVFERVCVENLSIYHGCQVFFADSLETFVQDLQRARPTIFFSVPRLWTKFQAGVCAKLPLKKQKLFFKIPLLSGKVKTKILTQLGLQHVRFAGTGSAPLSAETIKWYRTLGMELLEGYGMSENLAYSHFTNPGDAKIGTVGTSNPGVITKIGDNGEILVKSPADMMGYYKAEDKTRETFTDDGFLMTGDMGEIDEGGRLKITGRVKELFKISKGKYVAPAPIENKIVNHPAIEAVCVAGANQPATFAQIMLCAEAQQQAATPEGREQLEKEIAELIDDVNVTIDHHERMQFAVIVKDDWSIENGFLTPTMKIKRNVLEKHYDPKVEGWYGAKKKVLWED
ncbi:MAG: AMP-binding protein [Oceanococcus sp.]